MSVLNSIVGVTLLSFMMGFTPTVVSSSADTFNPEILGINMGKMPLDVPNPLGKTVVMDADIDITSWFSSPTIEAIAPPPPPPPPVIEEIPEEIPAEESTPSSSPVKVPAKIPFVPPAPVMPASEAQELAYEQVIANGWGEEDFSCLVSLWNRESRWNPQAANPVSTARGIPQAMMSVHFGSDWQDPNNARAQEYLSTPSVQITWGLNYIKGRYQAPCAAWAHSEAKGWY